MRLLKSLLLRFAETALLFSGLIGIGTSLVLFISSCLGYLPYSDRPGPGWWAHPHWPSLKEFVTYLWFAPWFAYFCLYFGLALFGLSLVLSMTSAPRWLTRIIGGVVAGVSAGGAVSAAGWYLAVAIIGPATAAILGVLYGAFLFPLFVQPTTRPIPIWMRASTVACALALFLYWSLSPFFSRKLPPEVEFDLIRVTPGDQQVTAADHQNVEISRDLSALNLHGQIHGGIGTGITKGPHIDVELVALEPIRKEAKLVIPRSGSVVYVLKNDSWTAYPSVQKEDKRTITVEPGINPKYDGGQLKLGKESQFHAFTWYPVIPAGQ